MAYSRTFSVNLPLLSLLFLPYNPYFFTTFSKSLSLLFPYFFAQGHLKACKLHFNLIILPYVGVISTSTQFLSNLVFVLQANSSAWQQELDSVHFTCSGESSLDTSSPTDPSQVIEPRRLESFHDYDSPIDQSLLDRDLKKSLSSLDFGALTGLSAQGSDNEPGISETSLDLGSPTVQNQPNKDLKKSKSSLDLDSPADPNALANDPRNSEVSLDFSSPSDPSALVNESRKSEESMDFGSPGTSALVNDPRKPGVSLPADYSALVSDPKKPEESLDFGSPTDHSTQVDEYRKPVTRCRSSRLQKGLRSENAEDGELSHIKYLGVISQPLSSQSGDSVEVMEESENKIETIDLLTSSDSYNYHSFATNDTSNKHESNLVSEADKSKTERNASDSSKENNYAKDDNYQKSGSNLNVLEADKRKSQRDKAKKNSIECRYLGIVTRTSKHKENKSSEIKLEAESSTDICGNAISSSSGLDHSYRARVKIEHESCSQSLLEQQDASSASKLSPKKHVDIDIIEGGKRKEKHCSQVAGAKQVEKPSTEIADSIHRTSFDRQSDISLTLSDKSVISPSPEAAEISHMSPFSVVGNVSRLVSTRIRQSARNIENVNKATKTTEPLESKSVLAPLIANLTKKTIGENQEDNSHTAGHVSDGSDLSKVFNLKSPRKNLEKLIGEIERSSQSDKNGKGHKTFAENKTSSQNDSSDFTEASVEVVVKSDSADTVNEDQIEGSASISAVVSSVADQHERSSIVTTTISPVAANISTMTGSMQGDEKPDFTNVLNTTGSVQGDTHSEYTNVLNTSGSLQVDAKPDFTNVLNTTGFVQDDTKLDFTNVLNITGSVQDDTKTDFTNVLNTTGSVQDDTKTDFTNGLNKTPGKGTVEQENSTMTSMNISNAESNHSLIEIKNVETNETRPLNEKQVLLPENVNGRHDKRYRTIQTRIATRKMFKNQQKTRQTQSVNNRETELKRCSVRLKRLESDTNFSTNSRSFKKFENNMGILKDFRVHETDARKNKQTKRKTRERNDKINVLTQKSASEESIVTESESGLEIRELSSSEDSSIEEVGMEFKMKKTQCDNEITSTQTTTSDEVLNFDSSASVYIESTQNTSSEEVSLSTTSDLQKNYNVYSPRAKPSSKWENVFYNWMKGYKKSGCDASQCLQCTTEEMNEENEKSNESIHDDVNQVSRTPRKQINRKNHEGKGEHEIVRNKSNDLEPVISDYCSDMASSIELISKMGKCIRECRNKLQNLKDTSASAIHDTQTFVQNSVQEQSEINESLVFDTNDSRDLPTGTQPFDTENIKSQSLKESIIPLPDILTGTQPFDRMSQTQGFVPDMLKTQRSSSSSSNECSFLSPIESKKADALKSQEPAVAQSPAFTLKSGLLNVMGSELSSLSKAQADALLLSEEIRPANLSKPTDNICVDKPENNKSLEQKKKETCSTMRYRIFREKGRQKSSDDIQTEMEYEKNKIEGYVGSISNATDKNMRDINMNVETYKCVEISSDSSSETIPDPQREKNETRIPDSDNIQDEEGTKRLNADRTQIIGGTEKQMKSSLSVDYNMGRNSNSSVTAKACNEKMLKALAAWKPLDLSTISVQPVRLKQREDVYKNILRVKPISKGIENILRPDSDKESSSPSVIEINTESEFDFDIRKHKNVKTYEPKKAIIDGQEMGNKNMWMNIVKAPHPNPSKLNKKRKRNDEYEEKKEILVRREIDGVYRFVRVPAQNSSNNSEDRDDSNENKSAADDTAVASPRKSTNNSVFTEEIDRGSHLEKSCRTVESTSKDKKEFQTKTAENEFGEVPRVRADVSDDSNKKEIIKRNTENNFVPESYNINEGKNSSCENNTNIQDKEFQAVRLSVSEADLAKHVSSNAKSKENGIEESVSRKRNSSIKRKHDKDENDGTDSKIQKTDTPVKENKEAMERSELISSGIKTRRQRTIESFFKDSVKKKHQEGMNLRSTFTQEWVAKQTFECLPSSEESQKSDSLTKGNPCKIFCECRSSSCRSYFLSGHFH